METLKLHLEKLDKDYYKAVKKPELVHLETYPYITISGQSAPESELFLNAIRSIYKMAYTIKFMCKGQDLDFKIPKMECNWFISGGPERQHLFAQTSRDEWMWKIAIRMPDFVTENHYDQALAQILEKDPKMGQIKDVTYEHHEEGDCVQILHIGSFEKEEPTLKKLFSFVEAQGLQIAGYHKEIYLTDPGRTPEDRLKTILRYQVKSS